MVGRFAVLGVALLLGVLAGGSEALAASARTAALQVGLRAHGFSPGPVDGVRGPQTRRRARRVPAREGARAGRARRPGDQARARPPRAARCSAGASSAVGALGWDVAVLEFRLRRLRPRRASDRRTLHARDRGARSAGTSAGTGSSRTGSPGRMTYRALARRGSRARARRAAPARASSRSRRATA